MKDNLSDIIYEYAKDVNSHANGIKYYREKGDYEQMRSAQSFFSQSIGDLYNLVHQRGGVSLVNCKVQYLKEIGMAYMKIAQFYKAGREDWYVNSVSAENAYYCLVRYSKETGDNSSLPFLFMLMHENTDLLEDKFKESCENLNGNFNRSFARFSLSSNVMISASVRYYHYYVQHFMLEKFYDFKGERLSVEDKALIFWYPNILSIIKDFLSEYAIYDSDEYASDRMELGEQYYDMIYRLCERALVNY